MLVPHKLLVVCNTATDNQKTILEVTPEKALEKTPISLIFILTVFSVKYFSNIYFLNFDHSDPFIYIHIKLTMPFPISLISKNC